MRPTRCGNSSAYVVPIAVPYDLPKVIQNRFTEQRANDVHVSCRRDRVHVLPHIPRFAIARLEQGVRVFGDCLRLRGCIRRSIAGEVVIDFRVAPAPDGITTRYPTWIDSDDVECVADTRTDDVVRCAGVIEGASSWSARD